MFLIYMHIVLHLCLSSCNVIYVKYKNENYVKIKYFSDKRVRELTASREYVFHLTLIYGKYTKTHMYHIMLCSHNPCEKRFYIFIDFSFILPFIPFFNLIKQHIRIWQCKNKSHFRICFFLRIFCFRNRREWTKIYVMCVRIFFYFYFIFV